MVIYILTHKHTYACPCAHKHTHTSAHNHAHRLLSRRHMFKNHYSMFRGQSPSWQWKVWSKTRVWHWDVCSICNHNNSRRNIGDCLLEGGSVPVWDWLRRDFGCSDVPTHLRIRRTKETDRYQPNSKETDGYQTHSKETDGYQTNSGNCFWSGESFRKQAIYGIHCRLSHIISEHTLISWLCLIGIAYTHSHKSEFVSPNGEVLECLVCVVVVVIIVAVLLLLLNTAGCCLEKEAAV